MKPTVSLLYYIQYIKYSLGYLTMLLHIYDICIIIITSVDVVIKKYKKYHLLTYL